MTHYRSLFRRTMHPFLARQMGLAVLALAMLLLTGCQETGQMADQARYDVFEPSALFADGQSARPLQPGSVPFNPDLSPDDPSLTGAGENGEAVQGWPVTVDEALVRQGQERYAIFCTPCHGPAGEGNGMAVAFGFPKPANLQETSLSNGEIFHVIRDGQGTMYPYGYRVKPNERWAIVAYLRALQIQGGPVAPQDITPELVNQIGAQQ